MKLRKPVDRDECLYRRSWLPERKYMNPDGTATSRVFKLRESDKGELSVDVKSMTSPEACVKDDKKFFLFEISNQAVLQISFQKLNTLHDPLGDGSNDAHAVIVGMNLEDDVTPGILARSSMRIFI
jgi:hypothetical protein